MTVSARSDLADPLLCVLRDKTATPGLEYASPPTPLEGGFWAELLAFELRDPPSGWEGQLVARVMPDPAPARKETIVQAAVAVDGLPTPRVRGWGGPDDGLGRAFMVMDRVDGVPLLAGMDSLAGLLGAPRRLWRMPDGLARAMAKLHAVDPAPIRAELADVTGVARTAPEMLDQLEHWSAAIGRDDLAAASRWMASHPVDAGADVVCHGDLHPFNVLVDSHGRATVLDWSTAVIAPRALDVAFTTLLLSNAPMEMPAALAPVMRGAGRGLARRFRNRYRTYSGHTVDADALDWFQSLVCLRALTEAASWVHDGVTESRAGHPWVLSAPRFAAQLGELTGVPVRSL